MDTLIFALCALTAAACSVLLLGSYRRTRFKLLLWSGLCFVGFTVNNVLLVFDRVVFPSVDMSVLRLAVGLLSVILLLCGMILESGG